MRETFPPNASFSSAYEQNIRRKRHIALCTPWHNVESACTKRALVGYDPSPSFMSQKVWMLDEIDGYVNVRMEV